MPVVPSPDDRVRSSLHRYMLLKLLNKGACANAFSATDEHGEKVFLKAYTSPTTLKPWYDAYLRYEIELNARLGADPLLAQQSVRALDAFSATFEHEGRPTRNGAPLAAPAVLAAGDALSIGPVRASCTVSFSG